MLSRKPLWLCSVSIQSTCLPKHSTNRTDASERPARRQLYSPALKPLRTYATVQVQGSEEPAADRDWWPEVHPQHKHPTPYQIFNLHRNEPYSKRRFYELVKIYHPDRNSYLDTSQRTSSCSDAVRLERYRLIVAAHEILSDPNKRHAYDRFGGGWGEAVEQKAKYDTHRRDPDGKSWYRWPVDQNPMYCATWEDWEIWYEQTGQKRSSARQRRAVYANRYAVVSLVSLIVVMSGIGQSTRLNSLTALQNDRVHLVNEQSSQMLTTARDGARDSLGAPLTRQERVRRFIRERDGYAEGELDGRALSKDDASMCVSAATKDKDAEPFWKKPPEIR